MPLPLLGAALTLDHMPALRDWILGPGRDVEIQDFVLPGMIEGDWRPRAEKWRAELAGHTGGVGIHGPFFGLDLSNPDREIRAIVTKRLLQGLELAEFLGGTHMVIHSPYTQWHVLNRVNYSHLPEMIISAAVDCLAPVVARAADIGCTVVLENIDDTDPADRRRVVERLGHPNLKLSIDTGHADLAHCRYGAPPVADFIADAGALLGHVHLQDVDGYADRHWHPGEGHIAWGGVFAALARLTVKPRLILEVRDRQHLLPQSVARLETMVA